MDNFVNNVEYVPVEVARMQRITLFMNFGNLTFVNIHLDPDSSRPDARSFFNKAVEQFDLQSKDWGFIAGDFNAGDRAGNCEL